MKNVPAVIPSSLGLSLRRWRVLNRIKQDVLAHELGVSQSRISRWESGKSHPNHKDCLRITTLLRARADSAADNALLHLVSRSSDPVHLVCDLTHRLLAMSPAREREWRAPVSEFLHRPLWRFATDEIRDVEHQLADLGWFEPRNDDIIYWTEAAVFPEMSIPESQIRISRLQLSDGSFARLVREETARAA